MWLIFPLEPSLSEKVAGLEAKNHRNFEWFMVFASFLPSVKWRSCHLHKCCYIPQYVHRCFGTVIFIYCPSQFWASFAVRPHPHLPRRKRYDPELIDIGWNRQPGGRFRNKRIVLDTGYLFSHFLFVVVYCGFVKGDGLFFPLDKQLLREFGHLFLGVLIKSMYIIYIYIFDLYMNMYIYRKNRLST